MKILHLSPVPIWDFEEKNGMPSIYWGLKGFVDAGHQVTYTFSGRQTRHYNYEGFWVHEFRLWTPPIPSKFIWLHRLANKFTALHFFLVATFKGILLSRSFKPDVVYGHFHAAPVAWFIGRLRGIPNITRIFGTFLFPYVHSFLGRMRKVEEVITFKTPCSYMIVTNDGTRGNDCAAILGVPQGRVKFWVNGVNKEMYDPRCDKKALKDALEIPHSHKIILAVSRLVCWKRVDRLLTALPKVLDMYPNVTAVIVGDGEERANWEALTTKLGVQGNVRFVGSVLYEEVPKFMNAADIFVSLYEFGNVGNPLLEALCCGKCIVSVSSGGTAQMVQNSQTGILLNETTLQQLPDVLVDLLRDDMNRERLGKAAREYAVNHLQTWPERIKMEVSLIEELVEGSKRG